MQTEAQGEPVGNLNVILRLIATHQQKLKWCIYLLLLLNFGYYMFDDWRASQTTLSDQATILEIMSNYATSLDELGWFGILFLLELETYWMEDGDDGLLYWVVQVVRLACYALIGHTLYAFIGMVLDLNDVTIMAGVSGACDLVGQDLYFLRNLLYDPINVSNCATLSNGKELYLFSSEPTVTDLGGYQEAIRHAWADVIEVSGWLTLSLLITFTMFVQDRGIYRSKWINIANYGQYFTYAMLTLLALYWAYYSFYIYTWDILLWMGGFAAIDANLSEWRDELKEESEHLVA